MTNGNTVSLVSVATIGAQSVTGALIDLNGTYQSTIGLNGGNIGFTGPVTLLGTMGVTTANCAISFSSTVRGAFGLKLNAGGDVDERERECARGGGRYTADELHGDDGNAVSLVSGAKTGVQWVTGAVGIDLNGTYQSTVGLNGGNIGFTGPVTLLGATGVTTANSAISFIRR